MIKLTIWAIAMNAGDGSGYVNAYATEADALVSEENAAMNEGFTDSITKLELEFNDEGLLLNPDPIVNKWEDEQ